MLLEAEQDGTHFLLLLITETPQHLGGYTWVALTFLPVVTCNTLTLFLVVGALWVETPALNFIPTAAGGILDA